MEAEDRRVSSLFIIPLTLGFVGFLLFVALLNGQHDLALVSLMLLGVAGGAKLWTRWSLARIACRLDVDRRRMFPGEQCTLTATVENGKWLPVWLQVKMPVSGFSFGVSRESAVTEETSLLWHQGARLQWEIAAEQRGVHNIGPLQLVSGDLFGFFPKARDMHERLEVIVYPRLVPLKPVTAPRRDFFGMPGGESPVRDPVYILGTRDYQHGRPAKFIHWKATARHHRLQEKIFEPTEQEKILLAVDVTRFAQDNATAEFERALEVVASLAVRLDEQGCAVGLVTNGVTAGGPPFLPVTRNPQQLTALLEALARLRMEPGRDLIDMLRHQFVLPWGISCFYFTLEEDETANAVREYFSRRKMPCVFLVGRGIPVSRDRGLAVNRVARSFEEMRIREARA